MLRALLLTSQSNTFDLSEHSFGVLKAMQLEAKSNVVGSSKQCSWKLKA